jgi:hypothetical protein
VSKTFFIRSLLRLSGPALPPSFAGAKRVLGARGCGANKNRRESRYPWTKDGDRSQMVTESRLTLSMSLATITVVQPARLELLLFLLLIY